MRLLEILIMTLAGVYQGVRQDLNLLEVALIAGGWWAWKKGWRPRYPAWLRVPRAWFRHPALTALGLVAGAIALRLALIPVLSRFALTEGMERTNNHAERLLR